MAAGFGLVFGLLLFCFRLDPEWRMIRAVVLVSALAANAGVGWILFRGRGRGSTLREKATLSVGSLVTVIVVLEIGFTFYPRSHAVGGTLALENWLKRYWQPVNKFGFRDREPDRSALSGKVVAVVGDSFAAGFGIPDVRDRFSNVLDRLLGTGMSVVTIARNGYCTKFECAALLRYPIAPDAIVLAYYGNDIETAAQANEMELPVRDLYAGLDPVATFLVSGSYLFNFVYWIQVPPDLGAYVAYLEKAYGHPDTMAQHLKDLGWFVDHSRDRGIPLVVVVIPFLDDLAGSGFFAEPVLGFFSAAGVRTIDVREMVSGIPLRSRIVNRSDPHASVLVHRMIAERLAEILKREMALDPPGPDATSFRPLSPSCCRT